MVHWKVSGNMQIVPLAKVVSRLMGRISRPKISPSSLSQKTHALHTEPPSYLHTNLSTIYNLFPATLERGASIWCLKSTHNNRTPKQSKLKHANLPLTKSGQAINSRIPRFEGSTHHFCLFNIHTIFDGHYLVIHRMLPTLRKNSNMKYELESIYFDQHEIPRGSIFVIGRSWAFWLDEENRQAPSTSMDCDDFSKTWTILFFTRFSISLDFRNQKYPSCIAPLQSAKGSKE